MITLYNHDDQKSILACITSNLQVDGLEQQKSTLGFIPVIQEQELEAIIDTHSLSPRKKIILRKKLHIKPNTQGLIHIPLTQSHKQNPIHSYSKSLVWQNHLNYTLHYSTYILLVTVVGFLKYYCYITALHCT